jgi:hypothetical protein
MDNVGPPAGQLKLLVKTHADQYEDSEGSKLTDYYYRIYAIDHAGNISEASDIVGPVQYGTTDIEKIYPVGSIYISLNDIDPATQLGFGTWERFAEGKFIVGYSTTDAEFQPGDGTKTGGEKEHTLTVDEMPSHTHTVGDHTHEMQDHVHGMSHTHQVNPPDTTSGASSASSSGGQSVDHSHTLTTGTQSADHSHTLTTGTESATHTHGPGADTYFVTSDHAIEAAAGTDGHYAFDTSQLFTATATESATHTHSGTSSGVSANHTHSGTSSGTSVDHTHNIEHTHQVNIAEFTSGDSSASDTGVPSNNTTTASGDGDTGATGGGDPHNTMPPYVAIYMWKRIP